MTLLMMAVALSGCARAPGLRTPAVNQSGHGAPGIEAPSPLPAYAHPRGRILDPADYDRSDVIYYRILQRSDFKGKHPPPHMRPYRSRLGAATCAYLVTTPETKVMVRQIPSRDRNELYEATLAKLGFRAQMDRRCSWWNSEQGALQTDYVLEHEQIHFALFELEARRLAGAVDELSRALRTRDSTINGARQGVQSRLERVLTESLQRVLGRSHAFDEDTSMGYRPEQQKAWLRRVESELLQSRLAF